MEALRWESRAQPLAAGAVAVRGAAALALGRKLGASPARLGGLAGVAGAGVLVLMGPSERLPWVDGAQYLGQDPQAPGLWFPTTAKPSVHPLLVLRALEAQGHAAPLALLLEPRLLVPLGAARAVDAQALGRWARGEG
jgi:hypothetical protein